MANYKMQLTGEQSEEEPGTGASVGNRYLLAPSLPPTLERSRDSSTFHDEFDESRIQTNATADHGTPPGVSGFLTRPSAATVGQGDETLVRPSRELHADASGELLAEEAYSVQQGIRVQTSNSP